MGDEQQAGFPAADTEDADTGGTGKARDDTPREQREGVDGPAEKQGTPDPVVAEQPAPVEQPPVDDEPAARVFGPDHTLLATLALEQRDQAVTQAREAGGYVVAWPAMTPAEQARYPQALSRVDCPGHCGRTCDLYAADTDPPIVDGDEPYLAVARGAGCLEDPPVCIGTVPAGSAGPSAATLSPVEGALIAAVSVNPTPTTLSSRSGGFGVANVEQEAPMLAPPGVALAGVDPRPARTALFASAEGADPPPDVRRLLGVDATATVLHAQAPQDAGEPGPADEG